MTPVKAEKYYTPRYVAEMLSLKPRTIARWCREGKLDAVKVGRVWRIPPDDSKLHVILNRQVSQKVFPWR